MKKEKKMKRYIAPNECSAGRWIAVLIVGLLAGVALSIPLSPFAQNKVDTFMGIPFSELFGILSFVPFFCTMVFAIKFLGKTSLKDFVLGVGGVINKKECLTVLGLYAAGLVISFLPVLNNIYLRDVKAGQFGFLVLFMLLVAWTQTTWEELIFRGIVIRWACKNNVCYTKKAVIAGVVSSAAFALSHAFNPEVTSQSGIHVVMAVAAYAIPGIVCYLADLHFGSLLPGILIHWLNNFVLFTLISSETTALPVPTLLVDGTPHCAEWMLISTAVAYLPVLAYVVLDVRKKRKAEPV